MSPEDKELIRLAARAFFGNEDEAVHAVVSLGWNPLAKNEDAFMVMVWLKMNFDIDQESAWCFAAGREHVEYLNPETDCYSTARRTITRCAATIGEAMS